MRQFPSIKSDRLRPNRMHRAGRSRSAFAATLNPPQRRSAVPRLSIGWVHHPSFRSPHVPVHVTGEQGEPSRIPLIHTAAESNRDRHNSISGVRQGPFGQADKDCEHLKLRRRASDDWPNSADPNPQTSTCFGKEGSSSHGSVGTNLTGTRHGGGSPISVFPEDC